MPSREICAACAAELSPVWKIIATSEFAIMAGGIVLLVAFLRKRDQSKDGRFERGRLLSLFGVGAAIYTFGVLVWSEMIVHGPTVSALIQQGFGDQRIGWLLTAIVVDGALRLYKELFWRERTSQSG